MWSGIQVPISQSLNEKVFVYLKPVILPDHEQQSDNFLDDGVTMATDIKTPEQNALQRS